MRWVAAVLGLLIALGTAEAGPRGRSGKAAAAKAKAHSEEGLAAYKAQDYDGAIAAWKEAYRLDPDPGTLFAIGQAQRLAGDCESALETYQEVLQSYISAKQGKEVRKVIELCEKKVGVGGSPAKKSKPAKSEKAFKPEKPEKNEPADEPEETEKPRSGFRGSATTRVGPPAEKRVDEEDADKDDEKAAPAEEREDKQLARDDKDKDKEPERAGGKPWYRDTLGTVLVGAGVVGLATGTTFLVLARGHESSAREALGYEAFDEHMSAAGRDRKISVVGFVAGGALVVGGVIRYMTRPSGAKREGVEVTGWVTPDGGAIGLGGAF